MNETISWLEKRLCGEGPAVIIDGGMGSVLEKMGVPMNNKIWSAQAMLTHPDYVRQAHEDFITAGAEVIITNTFCAARHMLEPVGFGDQVEQINQTAVKLAKQARQRVAKNPVAIAGSICEWTSTDESKWQSQSAIGCSVKEQAELLAQAGVDLIALEMCEQTDYSIAAIEAALDVGLPLWIGISAQKYKGRNTLSVFNYKHRSFDQMVEIVSHYPAMMINIMHTPVCDVDEAMAILKQHWHGPIGIYPESGYFIMPNWQFVDVIDIEDFADYTQQWINKGVRLVGGCCGIGPEHIAAVNQRIHQQPSK